MRVHSSQLTVDSFILIYLLAFTFQGAEAAVNIFNLDNIPAPPRSTRVETRREESQLNKMDFSSEITHYQSALSPEELINFYQEALPAKNWQAQGAARSGRAALASFSKGKEILSVTAYTRGQGLSDLYLNRALNLGEESAQVNEGGDAPGEDLSWAPRYPGALRKLSKYDKKTRVMTLVYAAPAQPEELVDFYRAKLTQNGWDFVNDVELTELPGLGKGFYTTMFFSGFRGQCQVSVNRAEQLRDENSGSSVLVNYVPQTALEE